MTFDWTQGPLAQGLRDYNAARFFEAHEAWESVWLHAPQPEKTFLQGLIQVTAAFEHQRRGNPLGTRLLLEAALRRLSLCPPNFGGLHLTTLRADIQSCLAALAADPTTQLAPPRIVPLPR